MKKYIDHIENSRAQDAFSHRNINSLRQALIDEFNNECGYCRSKLGLTSKPQIDQFYPKSIYPEKAFQLDNLVLSCSVCNVCKANKFPLDSGGLPLLLNPRVDDFKEHISVEKDGTAIAITDRGKTTIEILHLNRPELVDDRKVRELEKDYFARYAKVNETYFSNFCENLKNIRELNSFCDLAKDNVREHLRCMLFANIITGLETYLSDAFISTVKSKKEYLRQFIETFHSFRSEKFEVRELFKYYDIIEEKATKAMIDVIYHDLPKVKGMYLETLGIEFPDLTTLYKAVRKRHDFVHRNGKTKEGKKHEVSSEQIEELAKETQSFVININEQIKNLSKQKNKMPST
jgi:hypothetical protein